MTYGNDACEMIELCNKRTFFDLRRFDAETLQSAIFQCFPKRKSFSFFANRKNRNFPFRLLKKKRAGCSTVCFRWCPLSYYYALLLVIRFVVFVLAGVVSGKARKAGCFSCTDPLMSPLPLLSYMARHTFGVFTTAGRNAD